MSLRVLHPITRLTLGGSSENTIASCVALDRAGYDCILATSFRESDASSLADARRRGCRVVDIPALGREVAPLADLTALAELVRLIRRERPAIVHTHTSKAGFIGRLAAVIARVPAVIHQPHGHIFYGYYSPRRTAVFTTLERRAARWTDRIITLTDRGTQEHLARDIGRAEQYVAVPSGVPTDRASRRGARRAAGRARVWASILTRSSWWASVVWCRSRASIFSLAPFRPSSRRSRRHGCCSWVTAPSGRISGRSPRRWE